MANSGISVGRNIKSILSELAQYSALHCNSVSRESELSSLQVLSLVSLMFAVRLEIV